MPKKKKQLLSEIQKISYDNIPNLEQKLKNDDPIILTGVLQRANAKNQNNRIYPKEILDREVRKYKEQFVKNGNAVGECDHPDASVVEFRNVSHKIHELWWDGDDLMGKVEILSGNHFPCANILRGCLKNNIPIGFSSRGFGSEKKIGMDTFEVNDDFELICWDAVTNPSTHGAFGGYITESYSNIPQKQRVKLEINSLISNILS